MQVLLVAIFYVDASHYSSFGPFVSIRGRKEPLPTNLHESSRIFPPVLIGQKEGRLPYGMGVMRTTSTALA